MILRMFFLSYSSDIKWLITLLQDVRVINFICEEDRCSVVVSNSIIHDAHRVDIDGDSMRRNIKPKCKSSKCSASD